MHAGERAFPEKTRFQNLGNSIIIHTVRFASLEAPYRIKRMVGKLAGSLAAVGLIDSISFFCYDDAHTTRHAFLRRAHTV
jgi:hypothetical protein